VKGTIEREEDALVRSGAVEMPIDGEKERSKNYPFRGIQKPHSTAARHV
jgi:hypothetical protein